MNTKLLERNRITKNVAVNKMQIANEAQKLMGEHMQMLHDNMATWREMKPKAGMTEKERDEWFAEHQKIMDHDDGTNDGRAQSKYVYSAM